MAMLLAAGAAIGGSVDPADPAVTASRLFALGSEKEAVQAIRGWAERPPGERRTLYEALVAAARHELGGGAGGDGEKRALYLLCGTRRCSPARGVVQAASDAFCPHGRGTRGEEISSGELLHAPPPEYTSAAYKGRVEGAVTLLACVDRKGQVTDLHVERGLPLGLSEQAVRTVEEWRFRPARRDGERVVAIYRVSVHFQLE